MKKISKDDLEKLKNKGARVSSKNPVAPKAPAPAPVRDRLKEDLAAVQKKLNELARVRVEKKKHYEFTVERNAGGFITKIHAKEI